MRMHHIGLLTAASLGVSLGRTGDDIFAADPRDGRSVAPRHFGSPSGSIATGNRHGGPHLHRREIARRQRQAAPK